MPPQRSAMRLARLGALLALMAVPTPSRGDEPAPTEGPPWRAEYAGALEEARAEGRLLWIQFTGAWCPNCARMERDSFPDPAVVARTKSNFVAVKLRADAEEDLALAFDLTGLPASVIVDPSRQVVAVHQGYMGPSELDGFLGQAVAARSPRLNAEDVADAPRLAMELVGPPAPSTLPPAPAERAPATKERAALFGYCPVSLVADRRLIPGRPEYAVAHQGRTYRFATPATLDRFRRDPDRYVPANDGECPVELLDDGERAAGDPRFALLYKDRLYLCASDDDRGRFLQSPDRYAAVDVEQGGYCPHCLARDGRRVPGDPRFSLTDAGRRYWFPDDSHRDAFMSLAPSASLRR